MLVHAQEVEIERGCIKEISTQGQKRTITLRGESVVRGREDNTAEVQVLFRARNGETEKVNPAKNTILGG